MRYWWVNQKQTFRQEIDGGYMWSPKRTQNNGRIQFYENMRVVAPGDMVFSYANTRIIAIGTVQSIAYESPKPSDFGSAGDAWSNIGWRVAVSFQKLQHRIAPKQYIDALSAHLPEKYSPIKPDGNGNQVYLCEISETLASVMIELIGHEAFLFTHTARETGQSDIFAGLDLRERWEVHQEQQINNNTGIPETDRISIIRARRGQGIFRDNLRQIERSCRITRIGNPEYLIASHIQPWRHASNEERLDGENGLLLCPNVDLLFDRGLISFEDNGDIIVSPVADKIVVPKMGIKLHHKMNVGDFTSGQQHYLDYHRQNILLQTA